MQKFDTPPPPSVPHTNPKGYDLNEVESKLFEDSFTRFSFSGQMVSEKKTFRKISIHFYNSKLPSSEGVTLHLNKLKTQ